MGGETIVLAFPACTQRSKALESYCTEPMVVPCARRGIKAGMYAGCIAPALITIAKPAVGFPGTI